MLPAAHRLTRSDLFRDAVRGGRRAGTRTLVVHLSADLGGADAPVQVGFVVSKAVGNAVVRNRVKRRLRHLAGSHLVRLERIPGRRVVVVRALPAAARASWQELGSDLERSLERASA